MSTLEIILFVLLLAFCSFMAIFFTIHPVYTEEELKAMREKKKARRKERILKIINHAILGGARPTDRGNYW